MASRRIQFILKLLIVLVLIVGMVAIGTQLIRRHNIDGNTRKVQTRITELNARADNLKRNIQDRHNLNEIGYRAVELGMVKPDSSQKRIVTVQTSEVYTVYNTQN